MRPFGGLEERGCEVVVDECMDGEGITSGPAIGTAQELDQILTASSIRAVVPRRGGERAVEILFGELQHQTIRAC